MELLDTAILFFGSVISRNNSGKGAGVTVGIRTGVGLGVGIAMISGSGI